MTIESPVTLSERRFSDGLEAFITVPITEDGWIGL